MVDELSVGLVDLGQEVIVISPYYDRNRKGVQGYLEKDPPGVIKYKESISVNIKGGVELGVHEGIVKGVRVVFLHNSEIFPQPYPDATAEYVTRQISVFGKGCLEYLCQRKIVPSVCLTNDWFTGLTAAYAKHGHFGDTFTDTTFLHICHNLKESYEGRIFPQPEQGGLESLH